VRFAKVDHRQKITVVRLEAESMKLKLNMEEVTAMTICNGGKLGYDRVGGNTISI